MLQMREIARYCLQCLFLMIVMGSRTDEKVTLSAEEICSLPKKVGTCRAAFPKFYFDQEANNCSSFTYGGCGGNANNFETFEECNKICGFKMEYCSLPAQPGMCMAHIQRFFYNASNNTCIEFVFGGCQTNRNNFWSKNTCEKACKKEGER